MFNVLVQRDREGMEQELCLAQNLCRERGRKK